MDVQKPQSEVTATPSLNGTRGPQRSKTAASRPPMTRRTVALGATGPDAVSPVAIGESILPQHRPTKAGANRPQLKTKHRLTLAQKLAEVRRRIGPLRKRGYNQNSDYSYVTAADITGSVGDVLAELGVILIPRLDSVSITSDRMGTHDGPRVAQVVMEYTFHDVERGEQLTIKMAGEGMDTGDKATFKALTGSLKYALLQCFLLPIGDDPEQSATASASSVAAVVSEPWINDQQLKQLRGAIEQTHTELSRVLSHYQVRTPEELRQSDFRDAMIRLNRRLARQSKEHRAQ